MKPCVFYSPISWWGRYGWRVSLLLTLLSSLLGYTIPQAKAQSAQIDGAILSQQDLDGDGQPDLTVIQTKLATPNDRIYVYDGGGDMPFSTKWQEATDFINDTWVFDIKGDGDAQLVIRFAQEGNLITASLFDDQNGDFKVAVEIKGKQILINESKFPPLQVVVEGDWFLPDGQLNWNVRFLSDGASIRHINTYDLTAFWNSKGNRLPLVLDGKPDIELEFHDKDRDGVPEYGLWRLIAPSRQDDGAVRTWLWSNEGLHRPSEPTNFVFWPYLSTTNPVDQLDNGVARPQAQKYFDDPSRIWATINNGKIQAVIFSGYPIEQGYHVNTLQYFEKGKVNDADFENAQAYYDLANNQDGYPELHIRQRYYDAFDSYGWNLTSPVNEIRWSWKQKASPDFSWDYKLGLAGRYTLNSQVQFSDFAYKTVPYQELPYWVTAHPWDYATFVARETASFESAEGIYMWGAVESVVNNDPRTLSQYLAGEVVVDLQTDFITPSSGWRGELASKLHAVPNLYFSSIDHKLHLLYASQGGWKIDEMRHIHYENLGGDYINKWTLIERLAKDDLTTKNLYALPGYMILSDNQSMIQFVNTKLSSSPALFTTLPPRNHDEWVQLGADLEKNKPPFAYDDFQAMFDQFEGTHSTISNATLSHLRLTATGFRFELELKPKFRVDNFDTLNLKGLSSGNYMVDYDGVFHVQPLTSAQPEIVFGSFQVVSSRPLLALESTELEVLVTNTGLEDALPVIVQFHVTHSTGQTEVFTQTVTELWGDTQQLVKLAWTPTHAGQYQWTAQVMNETQAIPNDEAFLNVEVVALTAPNALDIWQLTNITQIAVFVVLLSSLTLSAVVTATLALRAKIHEET